jgi:hypothetical protein
MRGAHRPTAPVTHVETTDPNRLHRRGLERFLFGERRQDAGQPGRQHGLAGARRAEHQQAVPTRRRDFERATGSGLPAHIGKVGRIGAVAPCRGGRRHRQGRRAGQMTTDGKQVLGTVGREVWRERGFRRVGVRKNEPRAGALRLQRHGKHAAHRTQLTAKTKLADELVAAQAIDRQLARCRQDGKRDAEVEAPALLGQVGGGKVDGDAPGRKLEAAIDERAAHPIARLAHSRFGQADDGQCR